MYTVITGEHGYNALNEAEAAHRNNISLMRIKYDIAEHSKSILSGETAERPNDWGVRRRINKKLLLL